MINVAMDVHVRNSYVRGRQKGGPDLVRGRCPNTAFDLERFLAPVEKAAREAAQPVRVVLESTTNSRGIVRILERFGKEADMDLTAQVLHARKLRVIAESTGKCDRVDTDALLELAESDLRLPVCYIPDDEVFALREHLRARSDLVRMSTMLKNRIHALLHRRMMVAPAQLNLFTQAGREFLAQLDLDRDGRTILERYLVILDQLRQVLEKSAADLKELRKRPRWAKSAALLQTMPGVGLITALTILAELGDLQRFPHRSSVANFAGLVPVVRDSNEKHFSGGITHRGPAHLRAALVEAAWMACPRVPRYQALYKRVSERRGKQVAIVAVARTMLEDAWVMLKREEAFRYAPGPAAGAALRTAG